MRVPSNNRQARGLGLAILIATLTGCVTPGASGGFEDVRTGVTRRLGHPIQWRGGGVEDRAVDEAVAGLLSDDLTGDEAVQVALLNNRRLQATYEDLAVSRASLVQAGLLRNPVFDAAVMFPISGGQAELEFAVVQEFLSIFFIPLRRKVAAAEFEGVKLRVTGAVLDLAGQTLAGFYRVQAAEQVMEMRRHIAVAAEASHDLAQRLFDAGNIRRLDLANERLLYEQARLDLAAAEVDVNERRERLNVLMGLWGEQTPWKVSSRLPEVPETLPDLERLESRAVESSLDLAAARSEAEAFGRRLGLTRAAMVLPSLELGGGAEREEGEWEAGPSIELPIPLLDTGRARMAAARAEVRRRRESYAALAVEVRSAARSVRQRLIAAHRVARHYKAVMLPLRQEVLEQMELEYNAMQVGAFEFLLAKQQQVETGRRYIEATRDYWLAAGDLQQLLRGRLPTPSGDIGGSASAVPLRTGPTEDAQGRH